MWNLKNNTNKSIQNRLTDIEVCLPFGYQRGRSGGNKLRVWN